MPTKQDLDAADEAFKRADKARLKRMSEKEIEEAAKADPDNPVATDDELASAWRVSPIDKTAAE
ncbi:MAG: hypothetical protein ABUL73_04125 [Alphaproteobacteria bacterium]